MSPENTFVVGLILVPILALPWIRFVRAYASVSAVVPTTRFEDLSTLNHVDASCLTRALAARTRGTAAIKLASRMGISGHFELSQSTEEITFAYFSARLARGSYDMNARFVFPACPLAQSSK